MFYINFMMKWICLLREFSSMLEEWNMFKVLQIAWLQSFFQYCSEYSENKFHPLILKWRKFFEPHCFQFQHYLHILFARKYFSKIELQFSSILFKCNLLNRELAKELSSISTSARNRGNTLSHSNGLASWNRKRSSF